MDVHLTTSSRTAPWWLKAHRGEIIGVVPSDGREVLMSWLHGSITAAIERLSKTPDQAPVVNALKKTLTKVQRRMLNSSSANASTSGSIVDLSES